MKHKPLARQLTAQFFRGNIPMFALAVFAALVVLLGRVLPEMNSYAALFGWGCVFGLVIAAVYLAALCISQPCIPKTVLRTLRSWRKKT